MASPFFKQIHGPITTMNRPTVKMDGRLSSGPFSGSSVGLSSIFGLFDSLSYLVPLFSDDTPYQGSAIGYSGKSLMQAKQARQQSKELQRTSAVVQVASKVLTSILSFLL